MKRTLRAGVVVLVAGVFGLVVYHSPIRATELGVDFWNIAELEEELERLEEERISLSDRGTELNRILAIREMLIQDLIDRKLTFRDVVLQFHELNQMNPGYPQLILANFHGKTDLENAAHQVMSYLQLRLNMNPEKAQDESKFRDDFYEFLSDPEHITE